MLVIAVTATTSANVFINGAAFLIPTLHTERGLDLAAAGLLSSMPSFGPLLTLIAWGYVVDRIGERIVLTLGSVLISAAAFAAASVDSLFAVGVFLLLGGMAAASSNSASGRLVVGWFPPNQRGLVMGIRQTAIPLGVGLGALVIPRLAESHGLAAALLFPAVVCAASAIVCAVAVIDPRDPHVPKRPPSTWPIRTGVDGFDANPRRLRASRRAPGRVVDIRADVADDRPRVVGGIGRRHHHSGPSVGCRRPNRRRTLVGSGRHAPEADPHHRTGGCGVDGTVGRDGLARIRRPAWR